MFGVKTKQNNYTKNYAIVPSFQCLEFFRTKRNEEKSKCWNVISFHYRIQLKVPPSVTILAFGELASFSRRFIWHSENTGCFFHHSYKKIINVILKFTNMGVLLLKLLFVFQQLLQNLFVGEVPVSGSGVKRISILQVGWKKTKQNPPDFIQQFFKLNKLTGCFSYISHVHLWHRTFFLYYIPPPFTLELFPPISLLEQTAGDKLPSLKCFPH